MAKESFHKAHIYYAYFLAYNENCTNILKKMNKSINYQF